MPTDETTFDTFVLTEKNGTVMRFTVTRTPATLHEAAAKRPRWYLEVGPENIVSAQVVGVLTELADYPMPDDIRQWHWSYYLEIQTCTGKGIVYLGFEADGTCADGGADLCAFIPEGKGAAKVWGIYVSKKYKQWRGTPMPYVRAHKRSVQTCCGAEIYDLLAGRPWGRPLVEEALSGSEV